MADTAPELDPVVQRTRRLLLRADAEMEALTAANDAVRRLEASRTETLAQVDTTSRARANLLKLAEMAGRVEGAYSDHSAALVESSINSRNLAQLDKSLTVCYLLVALGKVADIYFVVYGKGKTVLAARAKLIPGAKTAIVDIANSATKIAQKGPNAAGSDMAKFVAQGTNAGFIADVAYQQGDVISELAEEVAKTQTLITTGIEIIKDVSTVIAAYNGQKNARSRCSESLAKLAEVLAKLIDVAARMTKLYEGFPSKVGTVRPPTAAQTWGEDLADLRKNMNELKISDYLAILKYAIEALQNLLLSISSALNGFDNRDLATQAEAQADREQSIQGAGTLTFDLDKFADLSKSELLDYVRNLDSAPDAHQMAGDAVIRAGQLRVVVNRMNEFLRGYPALRKSAEASVSAPLSQIEATDRELEEIGKELQAVLDRETAASRTRAMRGEDADEARDHSRINLGAWIGAIAMSRRKIHALTGVR